MQPHSKHANDGDAGADGTWVQPEQVVAPDQQGRCIAILGGDANNLAAALPWAQHAHILVLNTDLQVS